jgi:HK97 gp10 family phage protein
MSVRIEGIGKLEVKLDALADGEKVRKGLAKGCLIVERAAREKAPKDQGELKRSITSEVRGTTGVIYTPLEYAPYQEFGTGLFAEGGGRKDVPWRYKDDRGNWHTTSGNHPQPFMRPALQENRQQVIKAIKEGME